MTNEEAKAIIRKEYLCVDRDCDIERNCGKCDLMMPSKEPILEAYKMSMKALDQESVLAKIRAEIEQTVSRYTIARERGGIGQVEWSDRLIKESDVMDIIDKYIQKPQERSDT